MVGNLMGHADGTQVMETYSAAMRSDEDVAREAMDRAWTGSSEAAPARLTASP